MPIPAVVVGAAGRKAVQKGASKLYKKYRQSQSKASSLDDQRMADKLSKMRDNERKRRRAMKEANKE